MIDYIATLLCYIILTVFMIGWFNVFGDPYLTWWGLIHYLGNLGV